MRDLRAERPLASTLGLSHVSQHDNTPLHNDMDMSTNVTTNVKEISTSLFQVPASRSSPLSTRVLSIFAAGALLVLLCVASLFASSAGAAPLTLFNVAVMHDTATAAQLPLHTSSSASSPSSYTSRPRVAHIYETLTLESPSTGEINNLPSAGEPTPPLMQGASTPAPRPTPSPAPPPEPPPAPSEPPPASLNAVTSTYGFNSYNLKTRPYARAHALMPCDPELGQHSETQDNIHVRLQLVQPQPEQHPRTASARTTSEHAPMRAHTPYAV
jgi:hypothetical protein